MLTLLLSFLGMIGLWAGFRLGLDWMNVWSVTLAVLSGIGFQVGASLFIRKKITALMTGIQARITERTNVLRRKYEQLGSRGGNVRFLMDQARRDQDVIMNEALESTKAMDVYCKWSFMLDRQINAIRLQFLYQLKKFEDVDKLLPKAMLSDPILVCMKMCRQYKLGQEADLKKTYEKTRKKFKHDGALIYATYAWMLLRKKQTEAALKVLVDGKAATDDEVLAANWEHIVNGRVGSFSNTGLGEAWYALLLEEPKQPKPTVVRQTRSGGNPWRRR